MRIYFLSFFLKNSSRKWQAFEGFILTYVIFSAIIVYTVSGLVSDIPLIWIKSKSFNYFDFSASFFNLAITYKVVAVLPVPGIPEI